jgi:hypothetical protein
LTIHLVKNKTCLDCPICGVEKGKLTYSHTWLGLNPQIGRPLSRIVGAIGLNTFSTDKNQSQLRPKIQKNNGNDSEFFEDSLEV